MELPITSESRQLMLVVTLPGPTLSRPSQELFLRFLLTCTPPSLLISRAVILGGMNQSLAVGVSLAARLKSNGTRTLKSVMVALKDKKDTPLPPDTANRLLSSLVWLPMISTTFLAPSVPFL